MDAPATVYFNYGTTSTYGLTTPPQEVGPGPVAVPVTGLTAADDLPLRVVAGDAEGGDRTFTTAANPRPPGITNQRSREIGPDSATASASVNGNGTATTYRVEYGTSTRYGSQTPTAAAATGQSSVTVRLTGLRPYTRYHWRTVATNAAGTTFGRDRSFTTARLPESVTVALARGTVPWGADVQMLGGRVTGAGSRGMTVALQQQRFPLDQGFTDVATSRTANDSATCSTVGPQWTTTNYRVVTRTQVVVASPVVTARSMVRVGARVVTPAAGGRGSRAGLCRPFTAPRRSSATGRGSAGGGRADEDRRPGGRRPSRASASASGARAAIAAGRASA